MPHQVACKVIWRAIVAEKSRLCKEVETGERLLADSWLIRRLFQLKPDPRAQPGQARESLKGDP